MIEYWSAPKTSREDVNIAIYHRDHDPLNKTWSWGRDYGKDILADLNMMAHSRGDALLRDLLQRSYREIIRLRKQVNEQTVEDRK